MQALVISKQDIQEKHIKDVICFRYCENIYVIMVNYTFDTIFQKLTEITKLLVQFIIMFLLYSRLISAAFHRQFSPLCFLSQ